MAQEGESRAVGDVVVAVVVSCAAGIEPSKQVGLGGVQFFWHDEADGDILPRPFPRWCCRRSICLSRDVDVAQGFNAAGNTRGGEVRRKRCPLLARWRQSGKVRLVIVQCHETFCRLQLRVPARDGLHRNHANSIAKYSRKLREPSQVVGGSTRG